MNHSARRSLCVRMLIVGAFWFGMCFAGAVLPTTALAGTSCTNVNSTTTVCQSPGNVQIATSPGTVATPGWGWPYWGGGFVIGIGGRR
jgi:hypothetical protein